MKPPRRSRIWLLGILFLVLAALACDEMPPPLTGITCLQERDDGTLVALEQYNSYVSVTGGLTWKTVGPLPLKGCGEYHTTRSPWTLPDPSNPQIVYQFKPNLSIQRSEDDGATWRREVDLSGTEARTEYYVNTRKDGAEHRSGPLDALFDAKTGNLVVAMGYEGVLVRTPDAHWWWVTVGKYSRVDMRDMSITLPLISSELWLAALIGLVVAGTLPTLARGSNFWLLVGAAVSSAISLIGLLLLFAMTRLLDGSSPIGYVIAGAVALVVPTAISWGISGLSHQEDRVSFTWSGFCWTYLGIFLVVFASSLSTRY